MGVLRLSTLWLAILFIQACSPSKPPDTTPPTKTVFDPLTQQMDKARGVQQTVDRKAEDTGKAIDSQERGDSSQ
jgi:hypothetical protein